ncbi:uncharacterized protein CDV56_106714 [Aspergillus thermomutatus]|uniref:Uncharacterized protein n=1 Tax=Aspergillus thermomutatus TaxID=41047 RepID=A0A397HXR8_ASPTH|nr:uncharacterized protein CDV56_106714 [Aspergillus thermomutatus]RHZ66346.1 hypothetical protein CDV56_106714 [Aspergillus thermomutatus]
MPTERVYFLVFDAPPSNDLTLAFLDSFSQCLSKIERSYPQGVLITTSRIPDIYSKGFPDGAPDDQESHFWPVLRQLLECEESSAIFLGAWLTRDPASLRFPDRAFRRPFCDGTLCAYAELDRRQTASLSGSTVRSHQRRDAFRAGLVDAIGHIKEAYAVIKSKKLLDTTRNKSYHLSKKRLNRGAILLLGSPGKDILEADESGCGTGKERRGRGRSCVCRDHKV